MNSKLLFVIMSHFILATCNLSDKKILQLNNIQDKNSDYLKMKGKFDEKFVSHFPNDLSNCEYNIRCMTDVEKNNVGLILYCYNLNIPKIDSINNQISKMSIKGTYKSSDTCLMIINRFETSETEKNYEIPIISDSSKINRNCYKNLFPIPNFIDYPNLNLASDFRLDESFIIYVFEARSGKHFKKYNLIPSSQMPSNWKNGYSKGIAISKEKKTVIYWASIW